MTDRDDQLIAEMRVLRDRVVGVTEIVVASVDGLLIKAETDETDDADRLAALTSAAFSIARRAGSMTGKGMLRHTVSRYTDGYLVAQAIGELALIGVLGDAGMDEQRLQLETQVSAERICRLLGSAEADLPGN